MAVVFSLPSYLKSIYFFPSNVALICGESKTPIQANIYDEFCQEQKMEKVKKSRVGPSISAQMCDLGPLGF